MTAISISALHKSYGEVRALQDVSLEMPPRSLFCLLGPSGCGKTTLLRCIAGLETPDCGRIAFGGDPIDALPVEQRGVGMVFQQYALWPHMSVLDNLLFVLESNRIRGAAARRRALDMLALVHCDDLRERLPGQLSGGQQQRVALVRALVHRPRVLLLDEPLSNLDPQLRGELRREILRVHREVDVTMVYVTHDRAEALELATEAALLNAGRLVQIGPPRELYFRPQTAFAAAFVSDANLVPLTPEMRNGLRLFGSSLPPEAADPRCTFACLRPESMRIAPVQGRTPDGIIRSLAFQGGVDLFLVEAQGMLLRVQQPSSGQASAFEPGQDVMLEVHAGEIAVVPA